MPPKPVCFFVMPYGTKTTGMTDGKTPASLDFDALWAQAFEPAVSGLGYTAVRADQDIGALIVVEMLERLVLADLVIADVTLANANVYYEVGVRHVAKSTGCVLVNAKWSKPTFDLAQNRRLQYEIAGTVITEAEALAIKTMLAESVPKLRKGQSPVHALPDYPELRRDRAKSFAREARDFANFQTEVSAVRTAPAAERAARARELLTRHGSSPASLPLPVAAELASLARDLALWTELCTFIEGLDEDVRNLPRVQEQYWFAKANAGQPAEAIAALQQLNAAFGENDERHGVIGGRFKRMWRDATDANDKRRYLTKAIEHYERGALLDLNLYYCSGNLPALYRARGKAGDEERARGAAARTVAACERARALGRGDEWLKPTLLVAAFDAADAATAGTLLDEIREGDLDTWKIGSVVESLRLSLSTVPDAGVRQQLELMLRELESLQGK